ncbi:formylglycine-generating enzyme family protein [Sphaerospermopsis aphanizomenoides BCCUSP55]|uniref:formylglycine-generating enzyme family protein n=1 Tax=Sphaerospermopsis aphanizomenoides TaxID=459663 RepID=UPI001904BB84|nr:formylglycine-generating enzyme family protein [Sphaerospermopsis aphanizomenoides]MBK1989396.1 formylglycine-generating enzyme family protein [Sphaerospermopsis aphanizomenoides BCCUSP55]
MSNNVNNKVDLQLTIVELDLVESSKITSQLESFIDLDGTEVFVNKIEKLVTDAFNRGINRFRNDKIYDAIYSKGGDGYRLSFQDGNTAYQFVEFFCNSVEKHNSDKNKHPLIFRIAATTGEVRYRPDKSGLDRIIGHFTLTPLSRIIREIPGWFYVDEETFNKFIPQELKNNFIEERIQGKKHDGELIPAWRCRMIFSPAFDTITVNRQGEEIKRQSINYTTKKNYFREKLDENVTLDMVYIPAGTFLMGSPENEPKRYKDESPQHQVTVQPFGMGIYPVTQAQWKAVVSKCSQVNRELNPDPSYFKGNNLPVESISWYDAVEFCERLSRLTGKKYRLPSEAEWEYACRAGTTTPFHFGETITDKLANYNATYTYDEEPKGEYRQKTTPVGSFTANAFGLYDMHGNVWEWCCDHWHDDHNDAPNDSSAWLKRNNDEDGNDSRRVLRGGSWSTYPRDCRSAFRGNYGPDDWDNAYGFRLVVSGARTL